MVKTQTISFCFYFVLFLITSLVSVPLYAMESADNPLLIVFEKEEPEIFKRTNLVWLCSTCYIPDQKKERAQLAPGLLP